MPTRLNKVVASDDTEASDFISFRERRELIRRRRRQLEQEYKAQEHKLGLATEGSQQKKSASEIAEAFAAAALAINASAHGW
jgi:hypothetical protein